MKFISFRLARLFGTRLCFGGFGVSLGNAYHFLFIFISMLALNFRKIIYPITSIVIAIAKQGTKLFKAFLSPLVAFAIVLNVAYKFIIHRLKRGKLLFLFHSIYGFVMRLYSRCFAPLILTIGIYTYTADNDNATNDIKVLTFGKFHFLRALDRKDNHFSAYGMDFQYTI